MVLTLEFLGGRPIRACVGAAEFFEGDTRRYSRFLRAVAHIDVRGGQFILFHRAAKTICILAKPHAADSVRGDPDCIAPSKRSASSVFHVRLGRTVSIRQPFMPGNRPDASTPGAELSLS